MPLATVMHPSAMLAMLQLEHGITQQRVSTIITVLMYGDDTDHAHHHHSPSAPTQYRACCRTTSLTTTACCALYSSRKTSALRRIQYSNACALGSSAAVHVACEGLHDCSWPRPVVATNRLPLRQAHPAAITRSRAICCHSCSTRSRASCPAPCWPNKTRPHDAGTEGMSHHACEEALDQPAHPARRLSAP
jgi:hypothetical protein